MGIIPTADISAFIGCSDAEQRQAAAKALTDAVRVHGCAAITGHGIHEDALQDAFAMMRRLFDLPVPEKMKAPHPDSAIPHRGYLAKTVEKSGKLGIVHSKSESEKAFLDNALDWKETYDIGHEDNDTQKNRWLPDEVFPGFRPYMVQLFERLSAVSLAILEALILGMNLSTEDKNVLRQMHTPVEHQMRLAHYLPMSPEHRKDPNKIRLAPHKDFASYTLLFQESESGLEFQNRETGEYMAATPTEGVLYLNIGDIFEWYSNGFYPSAMHRVAIPPVKADQDTIPERFSIPFFTNVGLDELIYPMPSRVQADGTANYQSIKYSELAERLFSSVLGKA
ncbi:MAG: hypothetical protein Q9227_009054 [Pyrenula ochraceoflavens]